MTAPEVAGYTDLAEVGRGASATVYRANQALYARTVALKVIDASGLDEDAIRRFERECQAMGMLSDHPNIAPIFDSGRTPDGRPYLVTLYAPEGSLADRLKRDGPLDWRAAATAVEKLAGALGAAHEAGILHRDIKPENILVSRYGEPLLADFGIARMSGHTSTRDGVLTATIAHAAPELLSGSPPSVRTDVYALGSTLFTLLTGQPAFVRSTDESIVPVLARIATDPVPDLTGSGVPAELAEIVQSTMAKEPERRPATAAELQGRLRAALDRAKGSTEVDNETVMREVLAGAGAGAAAPQAAGPPAQGHRRRMVAGGIAVAVLMIAAVLVFMLRPAGAEVLVTAPLDPGDDAFLVDPVAAVTTAAGAPATEPPVATTDAAPKPELRGDGSVSGGERGLYGGTRNQSSCDVEAQIAFLSENQPKLRAFTGVAGVDATPEALGTYLRSLTPVVLRNDARVTNNTFVAGSAKNFQAVLRAGTAVLVDERGVPRVRCACGNPLDLPQAVSNPEYIGATEDFEPDEVATIRPTTRDVEAFELVASDGSRFVRPVATTGALDTDPPASEPADGGDAAEGDVVTLDLGDEAKINDYRVTVQEVYTAEVICVWWESGWFADAAADPPCEAGETKAQPELPFLILEFRVCVPEDAAQPFVLSTFGPDFEPYEYRPFTIEGFDAGTARYGPYQARIPGVETPPYASQNREVPPGDCFEGFWQWAPSQTGEEVVLPSVVSVEASQFGAPFVRTYQWFIGTDASKDPRGAQVGGG